MPLEISRGRTAALCLGIGGERQRQQSGKNEYGGAHVLEWRHGRPSTIPLQGARPDPGEVAHDPPPYDGRGSPRAARRGQLRAVGMEPGSAEH